MLNFKKYFPASYSYCSICNLATDVTSDAVTWSWYCALYKGIGLLILFYYAYFVGLYAENALKVPSTWEMDFTRPVRST